MKPNEMTLGNMGAEGVQIAIEDSMMAAAMSRENEGLKAEIEKRDERIAAMCRKHAETVKELQQAKAEVEALRKINRKYRRDRRDAYARAIRESKDEAEFQTAAWARCAGAFAVGVLMAIVMVTTVILARIG